MSNNKFAAIVLGLTAMFVAGILSIATAKDNERKDFMHECQDNGMRHYQCVAIWRGGAAMLIMPTPGYQVFPVDPN